MICFLVINKQPVEDFLEAWGHSLRETVTLRSYDQLSLRQPFPPGLYVFSDLERLSPSERAFAKTIAARLRRFPDHYRIANDPHQHLGRVDLIRRLHAAKVNDFTAYRVHEIGEQIRFPVFIRREYDHWGVSPLIHNRDDLRSAVRDAMVNNTLGTRDVVIVEYSETTKDADVFKKYSVFRFGSHYVPRHILASHSWFTKRPEVIRDDICREEMQFVTTWPGDATIERAFHLAGIDYGRIDYGLKDGAVRIWEINTNPMFARPKDLAIERLPAQEHSVGGIVKSFHQADFSPAASGVKLFSACSPVVAGKAARRFARFVRSVPKRLRNGK